MKTFFSILDKRPAKYIWRLMLLCVFVLSALVAVLGKFVAMEIFYSIPVLLASWYGSRKSGVLLSLTSSFLLVLVNVYQSQVVDLILVIYGLSCALGFSSLAILITNFRDVHREESIAADTDALTNILNTRGFYADLANELLRSIRYEHQFSLAYIDVDDFKNINDSLGHAEGDRLLIEVASCLKDSLRATDIVARLGGDEFACLFPEAGRNEAQKAFEKASEELKRRMKTHRWPVSFSVGLVTFEHMPTDMKEALRIADDLMYSVKNADKNSIAHQVWRGET